MAEKILFFCCTCLLLLFGHKTIYNAVLQISFKPNTKGSWYKKQDPPPQHPKILINNNDCLVTNCYVIDGILSDGEIDTQEHDSPQI